MLNIFNAYLGFLFEKIGMHNYFYLILFGAMIYQDFKYTEMLYAFMIEEGFNRSQDYIEIGIKFCKQYIDQHFRSVLSTIKLTLTSIIMLIVNAMPASVKPYTDIVFGSLRSYHEQSQKEWERAYASQTESEVNATE